MSEATKLPEQRPELPDFWNKRFSEGITPWEAPEVPAALVDFIERHPQPQPILIPGCGSAREAAYLAGRGWPVTAVDFSPVAVSKARANLGTAAVDLVCADFFTFKPATLFGVIYERAFLCALPRRLWGDWGKRIAELLPSGGLLAGYFFFGDQPKGPPFGILHEELDALLSLNFDRLENVAVDDSLPVFAGRERWQVWRRR